jgi:hypothetical protein
MSSSVPSSSSSSAPSSASSSSALAAKGKPIATLPPLPADASLSSEKDTTFRPVRLSAGPVFMGVSPTNLPISADTGEPGRGSPDELLRAFTSTAGGGHRLRGMTPSAATPSLATPSNLSTTPSNH